MQVKEAEALLSVSTNAWYWGLNRDHFISKSCAHTRSAQTWRTLRVKNSTIPIDHWIKKKLFEVVSYDIILLVRSSRKSKNDCHKPVRKEEGLGPGAHQWRTVNSASKTASELALAARSLTRNAFELSLLLKSITGLAAIGDQRSWKNFAPAPTQGSISDGGK